MTSDPLPTGLTGRCVACEAPQSMYVPDYCARCGAPVVLPPLDGPLPAPGTLPGVWRYAGRLPVAADSAWLTLGEGNTPLLSAGPAGDWCGLADLRLKLDQLNPTGSFKDRASAVGLAHARERGATTVLCASSGNAAGSIAAYAARAGLRAVLLMPEAVPPGKLVMAQAHGAVVLRVRGDYSNAFTIGRALAHRYGWINLTTTFVNPVAIAGMKTAGYEIAEQSSAVPDWILVPVGAGPFVHGILTAFRELHAAGQIDRLPRLVGVQASGCAPIADAYAHGLTEVRAWSDVDTIASGIADPLRGYPGDGTYTLRLLRESGGAAVAAQDTDIAEAAEILARRQGLLLEPAAAAPLAAARTLRGNGVIARDDLVVCVLTGHGLKTLQSHGAAPTPVVDDVADAVARLAGYGVDVAGP
ncbi:MAG: threonine synthase [Actinocatenispora sp.]